jgi:hypothetical protein
MLVASLRHHACSFARATPRSKTRSARHPRRTLKAAMRENRQRIEGLVPRCRPRGATNAAGATYVRWTAATIARRARQSEPPNASNPRRSSAIPTISGTSASNHPRSTAIPKNPRRPKTAHLQGSLEMELVGLEPTTSWVRCAWSPWRLRVERRGLAGGLRYAYSTEVGADAGGLSVIIPDSGTPGNECLNGSTRNGLYGSCSAAPGSLAHRAPSSHEAKVGSHALFSSAAGA